MWTVCSFLGITCLGWFYRSKISSFYYQMKLIYQIVKNIQPESTSVTISDNSKYLKVVYNKFGNVYHIDVPYNFLHSVEMANYRAELIRGEDVEDITQEPGIPYLASADLFDGDYIRITNESTGKFHDYKENEIPFFAQELVSD